MENSLFEAGGKGTRGKPYTDYFPKAMIPINGKPLINYIVINFRNSFKCNRRNNHFDRL